MEEIPTPEELLERYRSSQYDHKTLQLLISLGLLESVPAEEIKRLIIEAIWYEENREGFIGSYEYLGYKL